MKTSYIYLAFIAILGWNAFLIQRDTKLFKAYDACAPTNCSYQNK
jgi:hypothetical protein